MGPTVGLPPINDDGHGMKVVRGGHVRAARASAPLSCALVY
jgi:hypothetical protein